MATDDEDPKVKDVLGQTSEEDLSRWFSLPSFQQVEEKKEAEKTPDDEIEAVKARRQKALANVDPDFVDAIHSRTDEIPRELLKFKPKIELRIDQDFGTLDEALVAKTLLIAEPRIYDLPPDLEDELKECTPQALLRDLHRPEEMFDKQFEVVDMLAEQKLDVVDEIKRAMATRWRLPPLTHPLDEVRTVLTDLATARRRPWTEYLPALRNRRVRE